MRKESVCVRCYKLTKTFESLKAVDNIDIKAASGLITTFLGPSGCGKTTTLRLIAGLEKPDSGEIHIGEDVMTGKGIFISPEKRNIGMVFQSYAIWPHMTVFDNVSYPLKLQKKPKDEIRKRVKETLSLVQLEGLEDRLAPNLSGGQQQRVALARALVKEPNVLLLDEPLSNLDAKLREHMRIEIKELQRKLGITTIYVTHDQLEALALSDHLIVLDRGHILVSGDPKDIYERPKSEFVADFIGTTNLISGKVVQKKGFGGFGEVDTSHGSFYCILSNQIKEHDSVLISIRPGDIFLAREKPKTKQNVFKGKIKTLLFMGEYFDYRVKLNGQIIRIHSKIAIEKDSDVYLGFEPNKCTVLQQNRVDA
jgi:iron(III) transport system ATP-binding protein